MALTEEAESAGTDTTTHALLEEDHQSIALAPIGKGGRSVVHLGIQALSGPMRLSHAASSRRRMFQEGNWARIVAKIGFA